MLMNLLLNKTQPAEQPQKSEQPKDYEASRVFRERPYFVCYYDT